MIGETVVATVAATAVATVTVTVAATVETTAEMTVAATVVTIGDEETAEKLEASSVRTGQQVPVTMQARTTRHGSRRPCRHPLQRLRYQMMQKRSLVVGTRASEGGPLFA